ncbi:MAG: class I SAM-dependent methyltransferase, partial [Clostridiales bacterium]|nr:class I SAM-dependent methyltransferase [Clostridiales bacterium]
FHEVEDRFLYYLQSRAIILDFGCGSGRDTKYFLEHGFHVDAIDGSEELCRYASVYTGISVKCMLFQELEEYEKYDGIWACASILHVSKRELPDIFRKMISALKPNGIIYISFKYGDFEGERNGRYFSDFTEESFLEFLVQFSEMHIIEKWISLDIRPERGDEKWLNLILRKTTIS